MEEEISLSQIICLRKLVTVEHFLNLEIHINPFEDWLNFLPASVLSALHPRNVFQGVGSSSKSKHQETLHPRGETMVTIFLMEYYSAIIKMKLTFGPTWMDLEGTIGNYVLRQMPHDLIYVESEKTEKQAHKTE